jgi:acetyl esterase/lipase
VDAKPVIYPLSLRYRGIDTVSDVPYGRDRLQQLDVCLPAGVRASRPTNDGAGSGGDGSSAASSPTTTPTGTAGAEADADAPTGSAEPASTPTAAGTRAAIMMIHGGSWSHGDKATAAYHSVCQYFASEGFVVFNVDYRLAPTDPFPAGLDDVRRALDWVFRASTLDTYDVDPDRVGVFGGSAGGNLASLLALEDHSSAAYADGDRIRAVAELSGPSDLTAASTAADGVTEGFQRTQLLYLNCPNYADCPAARQASPMYNVTGTSPPFFIGQSTDEFIPRWESQRFAKRLRAHGVPVTLVMVRGSAHSIAQLDQAMSQRVVAYFRARLR